MPQNNKNLSVSTEIDVRVKDDGSLREIETQANADAEAIRRLRKEFVALNAVVADTPSKRGNGRRGSADPGVAAQQHRLDDAMVLLNHARGKVTPEKVLEYARKQMDGRRHEENLVAAVNLNRVAENLVASTNARKVKDARKGMDLGVEAAYIKGGRTDLDMVLTHYERRMKDSALTVAQQMEYAVKAAKEINYHMVMASKQGATVRAAQLKEIESNIRPGMSRGERKKLEDEARALLLHARTTEERLSVAARVNNITNRRKNEEDRAAAASQRDTSAASVTSSLGNAQARFIAGGGKDRAGYAANIRQVISNTPDLSARQRARLESQASRLEAANYAQHVAQVAAAPVIADQNNFRTQRADFRSGRTNPDEYRRVMLDRLQGLQQGTQEWDRVAREIEKAERKLIAQAKEIDKLSPEGRIRHGKSPLLEVAEQYLPRSTKIAAAQNLGAVMQRIRPDYTNLGMMVDPISAAQQGFMDYMQIERARIKGDVVLTQQAEYDRRSGRSGYDRPQDIAALNREIIDAAVNRVPGEGGIEGLMKIKEELSNANFSAKGMAFGAKGSGNMSPIEAIQRLSYLMPDVETGELTTEIATSVKAMESAILKEFRKQHPELAGVNSINDPRVNAVSVYSGQMLTGSAMSAGGPMGVMHMVRKIAGASSAQGLTPQQTIALASATTDVGIPAEMGGTSLSKLLNAVGGSVKSFDDRTGKYGKSLGIISQIMYGGKTEAEIKASVLRFKELFEKDAGGAVAAFMDRLQQLQKSGANVPDLLNTLKVGDSRIKDVVARLGNSDKTFSSRFRAAEGAIADDPMGNFRKRTDPMTDDQMAKFKAFQARIQALGIEFTTSLSGPIEETLKIFTQFLTLVSKGVQMFGMLPEPVKKAAVEMAAWVFLVRSGVGLLGGLVTNGAAAANMFIGFQKIKTVNELLSVTKVALLGTHAEMAAVAAQGPPATAAIAGTGTASAAASVGVKSLALALGRLALAYGVAQAAASAALFVIQKIEDAENNKNNAAGAAGIRNSWQMHYDHEAANRQKGDRIRDLIARAKAAKNPADSQLYLNTIAVEAENLYGKERATKMMGDGSAAKVLGVGAVMEAEFRRRQKESRLLGDSKGPNGQTYASGAPTANTRSIVEAAIKTDVRDVAAEMRGDGDKSKVSESIKDVKAGCAAFTSATLKAAGLIKEGSVGAWDLMQKLEKGQQFTRVDLGAQGQWLEGQAQPGDALFFAGPGYGKAKFGQGKNKVGYHTGVYLGNGMMRHEGGSGVKTIRVADMMARNKPTGVWAERYNGEGSSAVVTDPNAKNTANDIIAANAAKGAGNAEAKRLEADKYNAAAARAQARIIDAETSWDDRIYQADRNPDFGLSEDELKGLANQKATQAKIRDTAMLGAMRVMGTGKDGTLLNGLTIAATEEKMKAARAKAYQRDIEKIEDQMFALQVKRLEARASLLAYESREKQAAASQLETQLSLSFDIEQQHRLRQQILKTEREAADLSYKADLKRAYTIRDPKQRAAAIRASDAGYEAQKAGFSARGTKEGRDVILARVGQRATLRDSMGYADGSDAARLNREVEGIADELLADDISRMKGLGGTMDPAKREALLNKIDAMKAGYRSNVAQQKAGYAEAWAGQAANPEEGYARLRAKQAADRAVFQSGPDKSDGIKGLRFMAGQSDETRRAELARQNYRMRGGFDAYALNGDAKGLPFSEESYQKALAAAKTDEERQGVHEAYLAGLGRSVRGRYAQSGAMNPDEMRGGFARFGQVMSDAKGRGDYGTYEAASQQTYGMFSSVWEGQSARIARLPQGQRVGATESLAALMRSIPEWEALPAELRESMNNAMTDAVREARDNNGRRRTGLEARRSFEQGVSQNAEEAGATFIESALRGGARRKDAVKQFWDSILAQGSQSLAHVLWGNVLKGQFEKAFDGLKNGLASVWQSGEQSWGRMVNYGLSAMNALLMGGAGGKKAKKGSTWGGLLGAAAGFAIGGPAGAWTGFNVGGAAGAGFATGGLGAGLLAGGGAYMAQRGPGMFGGAGSAPDMMGVAAPILKGAGSPMPNTSAGDNVNQSGVSRSVQVNTTIYTDTNRSAEAAANKIGRNTYRAIHDN